MIVKNYTTVLSVEDLNKLKIHLSKYDIIAVDTETTGLNTRKDRVIGASFSGKVGEAFYFPIFEYNKEEDSLKKLPLYNQLKPILLGFLDDLSGKKLIMHNASYDIRIIESSFAIDLTPALYADTQLLKHTVDEEGSFRLKEIAVSLNKEIGLDPSEQANQEQLDLKEHIKNKGGIVTRDAFEIFKADISFLSPYACADADYTLRLYQYYSKLLKLERLEDFFYKIEVMPLFKEVTIRMEKNGLQLDVDLMVSTKKEIEQHLVDVEDQIQTELKPFSRDLKSELLDKHCPLKPSGKLAKKLIELYKIDIPMTKGGAPSLTAKNLEKIQGNEDVVRFLQTGETSLGFRSELEEIREQVALESLSQIYLINIGSNDQLSTIFYETLCETPESKTPTGKPKLDDSALERLSKKYKAAELIQVYRGLVKIKSTYIDRFLEAQENGLFYPSFKQFGTISGRYGSDMQQLPKVIEEDSKDKTHPLIYKYTNLVRSFFIAKPTTKLVSADYSALEVRVFADDAGDEPLLDVFRNDEDIYSKVAIQVNKLEGQYSAKTDNENFLKKKLPTLRAISKTYTLGIRYGLRAYKLAHDLNMSEDLCVKTVESFVDGNSEKYQKLIEGNRLDSLFDWQLLAAECIVQSYFTAFPKLKEAMEKYKKQAIFDGRVISPYGRVKHMDEAVKIYKKFGEAILDPKKSNMLASRYYMDREEIQTLRKKLSGMINTAYNFPIQSAAASIVNRAAIEVNKQLKKAKIKGLVIMQVHDELLIEVEESKVEEASKIIQKVMENTTKLKHLDLIAEPAIGTCYADIH